ncbi:hypothetical protein [Actinoallomurus iriomotensis]|uniref:DUF11 domain-containing protein n=1 Tax=Actinoallomurus iriomotensis TaxID=478107 RepID=A0A9W6S6N5_9ACTN|nr:hypothetical protein [Actinoallomurus iriomotensis]GLY86380.1 hypothetical protein Airi02_043090 [Actinoallomurus iriomotensis]
MRGHIALVAIPALAATGIVPPAYAAPSPAADLRMEYGHPQIATDNSGVTWHWVLTNKGTAGAETVVATHQVSADQKIVGVSQPCAAGQAGDIVCRFDSIKPGESRSGWIRTTVAAAGGTLRVNAQVTWHQTPGILPGIGAPSPVDAGVAAPGGPMTGTDAR